jgi:membrane protease YdiL (CAAX protease family)
VNKPVGNYKQWLFAVRVVLFTVLAFLGGQLVGAIILTSLLTAFGMKKQYVSWALESHEVIRFLLILTVELITVYFIYLLLKRSKQTFKTIGLSSRPKRRDVIWTIKGFALYFVTFITVFNIVSQTGLIDTNQSQQLGFVNPSGYGLLWAFLSLVILPPIVEEIVFRGYLLTNLKKYINVYASAIVVSVLFAAAHLELGSGVSPNFAAALDTFVLSLVLVYVTHKTNSLYPAIGIHAVKNLIAFVTLFVLK